MRSHLTNQGSSPRRPGRAPSGAGQLIAVPGGIEHYFAEVNRAGTDAEQEDVGARYDIRVA